MVYSLEEFRPLAADPSPPQQEECAPRQRVTLGSSSFIPPIFGLTMAGEVIRELLDRVGRDRHLLPGKPGCWRSSAC
ncbi:MAG: hypothetical protein R2864_15275 [Syntrophotaleaceae bacterium]